MGRRACARSFPPWTIVPGPRIPHQRRARHAAKPPCSYGASVAWRLPSASSWPPRSALSSEAFSPRTGSPRPTSPSEAMRLTLLLDMALAGVAACGLGALQQRAVRRVLWVSIVCGMVGHGIRYLKSGIPERGVLHAVRVPGHRGPCQRRRRLPAAAVLVGCVRRRRTDDAGGLHSSDHCGRDAIVSCGNGGRFRPWPRQPWRSPPSRCSWSARW